METPARPSVPQHVAIIMDGNGRWAGRRGSPRIYGHIRGANRVKPVVKRANALGVKALTLFAFSTENWTRPETEIQVLWKLLKKFLVKEADELDRENVRLNFIGETDRLDQDIQDLIFPLQERLSQNTGLILTFAISYGSRREIALASQKIAQDVERGELKSSEITESTIGKYLWTNFLGSLSDVDLVIRTSGENRVSNFLLWQSAYAEYHFTETFWPDFSPAHLEKAIEDYSARERRYGGVESTSVKNTSSSEKFIPEAGL